MARVELSMQAIELLKAARRMGGQLELDAILMLAELPYSFAAIAEGLREPRGNQGAIRLLVAADKPDVQQAALADEVELVSLSNEPAGRQAQLSQAVVDAIADDLLPSGGRVAALYPSFDREQIDALSILNLTEQLAKLTSRDLQRLNTKVPLDVLRRCVDLAVQIGREGREGKPVGTIIVVGDHRRVLEMSHEGVHDPFKGYTQKEKMMKSARTRESMKELSQIDGAFVVSSDGVVMAAGRILAASVGELALSKGLGARHYAAAAISKATDAVALAVSESTGTVRLFQNGRIGLQIEPMDQAMTWHMAGDDPED